MRSLLSFALISLGACAPAPGSLVPLTVVDDPELPRVEVVAQGQSRLMHVREFGRADAPTILLLHGSASDMRAYLPLAEHLAATQHVILVDMLGNGLSERVPRDETTFQAMADDIESLRVAMGIDEPFTLLGYSWSSVPVALYAAAHPERLARMILLESPGLKGEWQNEVGGALNLLSPGYLEMVNANEVVTPVDHERADYQVLAMLYSGVRRFSCPNTPETPMPVWRPGALALAEWETSPVGPSGAYEYDFTAGLDSFTPPVLIVGTPCSPIGFDFQKRTNATLFQHAQLAEVPDAGHRMIVENLAGLETALDGFLTETPP